MVIYPAAPQSVHELEEVAELMANGWNVFGILILDQPNNCFYFFGINQI